MPGLFLTTGAVKDPLNPPRDMYMSPYEIIHDRIFRQRPTTTP